MIATWQLKVYSLCRDYKEEHTKIVKILSQQISQPRVEMLHYSFPCKHQSARMSKSLYYNWTARISGWMSFTVICKTMLALRQNALLRKCWIILHEAVTCNCQYMPRYVHILAHIHTICFTLWLLPLICHWWCLFDIHFNNLKLFSFIIINIT